MRQLNSGALTTLLVLTLALSACGFKLRGSIELPVVLQDTYIESQNPFTGMARALRNELKANGANVLETQDNASAVLAVLSERSENRVLSVGSSGRASEYELFDEVVFELRSPDGDVLLPKQTLRIIRDLVFDETALLGKISEADGIHRQMRANLARQIIVRIEALMRQQ